MRLFPRNRRDNADCLSVPVLGYGRLNQRISAQRVKVWPGGIYLTADVWMSG
jgi:hypothetical protein